MHLGTYDLKVPGLIVTPETSDAEIQRLCRSYCYGLGIQCFALVQLALQQSQAIQLLERRLAKLEAPAPHLQHVETR